jgi:plasmid stabilization system protein ParE
MLVQGNYLVLYRITESFVDIVRVVHGARDLDNLL